MMSDWEKLNTGPSPRVHHVRRHGNPCNHCNNRIAAMIAERHSKPYSRTMHWIRCRLSFSLLRSAIVCLWGSRSALHRPAGMLITTDIMDLACSESRVPIHWDCAGTNINELDLYTVTQDFTLAKLAILTWRYLYLLKMTSFLTTANLSYDQKCWHFSNHTKLHSDLQL